MKISLKWLSDFVEIQEYFKKPEALADILTKAGLEVEEITQRAKDFQSVVIGLVLEKDKHPNADKLSLCKVMTGNGVVHQIVCGAQNHKQNDKVVVALPGAILPGNFAIKQAVVRGIESGGMICSQKELGLAVSSEGVLILPPEATIGQPFAEYMGYDDVSFELKVTPNRADCLSHYGLAREISCLLARPLKALKPEPKISEGSTKSEMALEVKSALCPRYAGRFIRGVKIADSPEWIKKRLEGVGMNSINNVVDVTNYVMMELGQPLHAFDSRELKGKKVIVEKAKANEKFITLDGTELTLTGEELMIRDAERSVAMAGVVGGKNSGVQADTTDLFLEAAYFLPAAVRKASRIHGINTDSGYRFSRGVDPENTILAMDRAVQLLLEVAGGEALGEPHDHYPEPQKKQSIDITVKTVSDRLGYLADSVKLEDYMRRLGCDVSPRGEGMFSILPPSFRFDLETEIDLVEEYARLGGYDLIPETLPESSNFLPSGHDPQYLLIRKVSETLRAVGFTQAINMAFTGQASQALFLGSLLPLNASGIKVSGAPVAVVNPLGLDQNVMRQTLVQGLLKNVHHNFSQGQARGRVFETGKTFSLSDESAFIEHSRLGLVAWGQSEGLWDKGSKAPLIFEVKAALERLLAQLHITSFQWITTSNRSDIPDFAHRGQYAQLQVEGVLLGFIGSVHPVLLDEEKIRVPVALAEVDLAALFKGQPRSFRVEAFSRFPKMERDLALLMPKLLKTGEIAKEIKKSVGAILASVSVFDLYEGDKLPEGKKSAAFRISFQDKNATLQEQAVNDAITKVLSSLKEKFEVEVR
jgi:phenylalanyl-tRNA synthetase beta chain